MQVNVRYTSRRNRATICIIIRLIDFITHLNLYCVPLAHFVAIFVDNVVAPFLWEHEVAGGTVFIGHDSDR